VPRLGKLTNLSKRSCSFGRPLRSDRLGETFLPKGLALPVFASDALSSVARLASWAPCSPANAS
jgi:hypothetical protein